MKKKPSKKVVYQGRRRNPGSENVYHLFVDEKGGELTFSGIKLVTIGRTYLAYAKQINTIPVAAPEADAIEVTEKQIHEWEVQDKLAEHFLARKRMSNRLSREPRFMALVERFRPIVAGLTAMQRRQLVEWIVNKLGEPKR